MNDPLKYAIRIDLVRTNYNFSVVLQDYYQRDVLQKYYPNLYIHLNTFLNSYQAIVTFMQKLQSWS